MRCFMHLIFNVALGTLAGFGIAVPSPLTRSRRFTMRPQA
jgi:hypothetical protein